MYKKTSVLLNNLTIRKSIDVNTLFVRKSYIIRNTRVNRSQHNNFQNAIKEWGILYDIDTTILHTMGTRCEGKKLCIDIGFGAGETLLDMAQKNPQTLYLGIEMYKQGIAGLYNRAKNLGVANIFLTYFDAIHVLAHMVPSNCIDSIHIFFPDPWQKKRHHKRRLLHFHFLNLCYEILKPDGILWIVSDWQNYALDIQNHITYCNDVGVVFEKNDALCKKLENLRIQSRFEMCGKNKNHTIHAFVYNAKKHVKIL